MEELEFYDVKSKNKFKTTDYEVREKKSESKTGKEIIRYFAVTKSPNGDHECWRVVSKDFAAKVAAK